MLYVHRILWEWLPSQWSSLLAAWHVWSSKMPIAHTYDTIRKLQRQCVHAAAPSEEASLISHPPAQSTLLATNGLLTPLPRATLLAPERPWRHFPEPPPSYCRVVGCGQGRSGDDAKETSSETYCLELLVRLKSTTQITNISAMCSNWGQWCVQTYCMHMSCQV